MLEQEFQKYTRRIRDEGRNEGRRHVLVRQLEKRFGTLDGSVLEHIASADEAQLDTYADRVLDTYADRVLDATSVADVLGARD